MDHDKKMKEIFVRVNEMYYLCTAKMGKSFTACSLGIPQGLIAARVLGCSGAMQVAFPPASLAQLARARDL